ncbi:MAG: sugar phosphate isomerase/epimerase family protein [Bacteroidota bacterium]
MSNRRKFIYNTVLGIAATSMLPEVAVGTETKSHLITSENETFKLGIAGYTFLNFKLEESLKIMKKLDTHFLCIKDFHLPLSSTAENISIFQAKLKEYDVMGYAVGPIYTKSKAEIDNSFNYAKRVGVNLIIGIPAPADLPYVNEKVKETNIRYAIHNHGPEDELYPTVERIYELIKNLDERVGICFDIGHDTRAGKNAVTTFQKYSKRIFDMHLKNVTAAVKSGTTCELGRGVINIPALVRMMRKIKYSGCCSLEYEKDMKDPLAGIAESVGYFRGICDSDR